LKYGEFIFGGSDLSMCHATGKQRGIEDSSGWKRLKSVLLTFLVIGGIANARTITREEALKLAYPGAEIQSKVLFLSDTEKKEVERVCGAPVTTALVARYTLTQNGHEAGRSYLDTHIVRTKKESVLVMLNSDGTVKRVEVVAFLEPPEYLPAERWYRQFDGKQLNENLKIDRDIHAVTGATLTAKATTEAVRRILAIDAILQRKGPDPELYFQTEKN